MLSNRSEILDSPALGGCACIAVWHIDYMANFLWEVPTRILEPYLPRGIYPVEPVPGVSLIDVGHVRWADGNFDGRWPAFDEVTITALVQPDLSRTTQVPKFCFFVLKVASNNLDFTINENRTLHLPTWHTNIRHTYDANPYKVHVSDDRGPMFSLESGSTTPAYSRKRYVGQYYTLDNGELWFGLWAWEGEVAQHQHTGYVGRLHDHPVFAGLEVDGVVGTCFMQLFTKPGVPCIERFYAPIRIS